MAQCGATCFLFIVDKYNVNTPIHTTTHIMIYVNFTYLDCLPEKKGALYELKKTIGDASEVVEFKYIEKKQVSPDTFLYTYEIPNVLQLGLNLGQHIAIEYY